MPWHILRLWLLLSLATLLAGLLLAPATVRASDGFSQAGSSSISVRTSCHAGYSVQVTVTF